MRRIIVGITVVLSMLSSADAARPWLISPSDSPDAAATDPTVIDTTMVEVSRLIHADMLIEIEADALLVAVGRRPCVDSLNLQSANVDFDARGIQVDRKMRTSNKRVYACGDVTGEIPLTHVAELQAGIIIANMIFKLPKKISYDVVPAVVYTDP